MIKSRDQHTIGRYWMERRPIKHGYKKLQ